MTGVQTCALPIWLVGELVNVDGKSKIAVRLNMLGCACVDMPIGYVEPIGEKN